MKPARLSPFLDLAPPGPPFPALFTSVAVHDRQGRSVGRRWLLRDLTEQKRLHEQLVQAQKMEAVRQLAGGVAADMCL